MKYFNLHQSQSSIGLSLMVTLMMALVPITASYAAPPKSSELTAANYRDWIEHIRPSEAENKWSSIAWRNKFMPAVEEATKLDRPILLWTMNGNPCGET